ncbi:methyltransferase domain-containing protein [Geobacter pelophilus]|uniref:Methyltransferase domain-containing protein n=1 Tax=Geoanaerobacter pelophilus TaxID=60036 RepID=A0AAW4L975_9BACT|nr:class I SAM-dependent methyltransferase [Geoanaerobacter pelophilus]MBT0666125.1 methyltransferase domain-containing protein [Geoanaerobacter pelophilus]
MNWNERYSEPGFSYGTAPNEFLVSVVDRIPNGRILSLAEGEGRNAVYLASLGYQVTGVDGSEVGLRKAAKLALERGVTITTIHADLSAFEIEPEVWDGIVAIYCHLPSAIRIPLHQAAVRGLKPGGAFVLEAFSKDQLPYDTGGPKSLDMLMSLDDLKQELAGLEFVHAVQMEREVLEGRGHTGLASVVQVLGIKP